MIPPRTSAGLGWCGAFLVFGGNAWPPRAGAPIIIATPTSTTTTHDANLLMRSS